MISLYKDKAVYLQIEKDVEPFVLKSAYESYWFKVAQEQAQILIEFKYCSLVYENHSEIIISEPFQIG